MHMIMLVGNRKFQKLPCSDESKDKMKFMFDTFAKSAGWHPSEWVTHLGALLPLANGMNLE